MGREERGDPLDVPGVHERLIPLEVQDDLDIEVPDGGPDPVGP